MRLYLSSGHPEVLDQARSYIEKALEAGAWKKEKEDRANHVQYTITLPDAEAEALLDQLLSLSPELDIEATMTYDLEGRDRSFWGSTRYQSAADENGKRYFQVSTSTGWA